MQDIVASSLSTVRTAPESQGEEPRLIRLSEIISALSYALDLTEGQPMGHSVRTCILGMRIAQHIGMPVSQQGDLYYSLLLKDAGCSSNSSRLFHIINADDIRAKGDLKTTDWTRVGWESLHYALTHVGTGMPFMDRMRKLAGVAATQQVDSKALVQIRCDRGASIARKMSFGEPVAAAIYSLDEHWNGGGYPDGLVGQAIPMYSRIMNLAQTLDVFVEKRGREAALDAIRKRRGRWFDPELVQAALSLAKDGALWAGLDNKEVLDEVVAVEPEHRQTVASEETIEDICLAFAAVIDSKSPFTYRHSNGVAEAAVAIGQQLGMAPREITFLRRAALLHDIGKLSVPNSILEKPGKLTSEEWDVVKKHPYYTLEILRRIPGLESMSEVAAAHHEKLDGSGYFRHWSAPQLSVPARILAVADIYDALAAQRPYRDAMPVEQVFSIMQRDAPRALDSACLDALMSAKNRPSTTGPALRQLSDTLSDSEFI
jgi:putative nucleotidyltransferase with HDIG domain